MKPLFPENLTFQRTSNLLSLPHMRLSINTYPNSDSPAYLASLTPMRATIYDPDRNANIIPHPEYQDPSGVRNGKTGEEELIRHA